MPGCVLSAIPRRLTPSILRKSVVRVCVLNPPETPILKCPPPINSFEVMSILAPPTSLLPPALKALFTPMPTNTARPTASSTGNIHFGKRLGWRTSTMVSMLVTIATTRSVGSFTQNTGPWSSAMSRIVPPPTAVTTPSTRTPKGSIRNFPANKTPEMANTAVPTISSQ